MALYSRVDGCGSCIKYCFFGINLAIFIGAITLTIIALVTIVDKSFANEILGTNLYGGTTYVLFFSGLLTIFVSCLGCYGSIKEIRCLLVAYFVSLFLIFVVMLVGGIVGYVFREKIEITLRNGMYGSIRLYGNYRPVSQSWDEIQSRLYCCGVESYKDWKDHIPDACCKPIMGRPQRCQLQLQQNSFTIYQRGCFSVTKEYVKDNATIIATVGVVLAFILLLGMVFSCILFRLLD